MTLKTKYRIVIAIYSFIPILVIGFMGVGSYIFPDHEFQHALVLGFVAAFILPMISHCLPGLNWIVMNQIGRIADICAEIRRRMSWSG